MPLSTPETAPDVDVVVDSIRPAANGTAEFAQFPRLSRGDCGAIGGRHKSRHNDQGREDENRDRSSSHGQYSSRRRQSLPPPADLVPCRTAVQRNLSAGGSRWRTQDFERGLSLEIRIGPANGRPRVRRGRTLKPERTEPWGRRHLPALAAALATVRRSWRNAGFGMVIKTGLPT
jgi:hypothetical protein